MVDTFCGVLADAHYATKIRKWTLDGSQDGAPNLGQVFIAVDPNCFAPGFEDRMTDFNGILRDLPPVRNLLNLPKIQANFVELNKIFKQTRNPRAYFQVDESKPVLVPGDPERAHMKKVDEEGGLQYHINQITSCDQLADKLNIPKLGSL